MPVALHGTSRSTVSLSAPLPQVVPSRTCLTCDVCCRFPEPDSFLRPYFTGEEIVRAVERGADPGWFPDPAGSQVTVVPNPQGEGYLCPAFDPETSHCRIYDVRPLDCQLYPFAVMWDAQHDRVLLGWDTKCPYMRENAGKGREARGDGGEIEAYVDRIAGFIEREDTLELLTKNPQLVGRFQGDVIILRALPRLTERLSSGHEARGTGLEERKLSPSHAVPLALQPLTLADRDRVERAVQASEWRGSEPLAAYSFAYHFIWRSLFSYGWVEIDDHFCLFAESPEGLFMPLPPLGARPMTVVDEAFRIMQERNRGRAVTRIENVPAGLKGEFERAGYRLTAKDGDYLYRSSDLVALAGDRYKSQRAACNRFEREVGSPLEPFADRDRDECHALYRDWRDQKRAEGIDMPGQWMLADSEAAHHEAIVHDKELGLVGAVVRVTGAIRAYTFGYRLMPSVFCVLLEVADRRIAGLAQFLFREFVRKVQAQGADSINTMDDSGLASLARSKKAYHPIELIPNWIVTA